MPSAPGLAHFLMKAKALVLIFVVSLAVLVAAPLLWPRSLPVAAKAGPVAEIEASLEPDPEPAVVPDGDAGEADVVPAIPTYRGAPDSNRGPEPVALHIGEIEVHAPVIKAGVEAETGEMEVPDSVDDVAWYRFGPSPGQPGSAVLAAHVDLWGQGPGVFYNLRTLELGDDIRVVYDDGTSAWFRVAAKTTYTKEELPLDFIFSRSGQPVLTLVTCGGGFSRSERSYDSNVVVYAVPSEAPAVDGVL